MADIYAVAISPDKDKLVLRRGKDKYALIERKKGIGKGTKWRTRKLLSQMVIKGQFKKFDKPMKYKGLPKLEKSRKSVDRLDESGTSGRKKSKHQQLIVDLGLGNVASDVITHKRVKKAEKLILDLEKANNSHLPANAERYSYKCDRNYNIVYIPVNRLKQVYQSDEALNPRTVNRKCSQMKAGKLMPPVQIGYDYDVHDGHHSWNAAIQAGYSHVPCEVVGSDPKKVKQALDNYRKVWKSESEDIATMPLQDFIDTLKSQKKPNEKLERSEEEKAEKDSGVVGEKDHIDPVEDEELWKEKVDKQAKKFKRELGIEKSMDLAIILDLAKAVLNRGKLVKKRVAVKGKNGKIFYRMQWIDPNDKSAQGEHPGVDHSTFAHHEEGLKEMEKRQSNRFPVVHHPTKGLKNTDHNYRQDTKKYAEAESKYKKGEKLPPVKITPHGEILDNHHLVDLAKKHGLSHVPSVVVGNPNLKKQLEDKLKDRVVMKDESGEQVDLTAKHPNQGASAENVADLDQFKNFTKKRYTKQHLMNEAKRQGIKWNEKAKDGSDLPQNSKIMWMRAHQAIENHIKDGHTFEVTHDEKDVDKRMQQDGKDTIHKHFLKLLEKHGSKDNLLEWARSNGIIWKEKSDPDMNWMYGAVAIKKELAKGKMVDGVRTRQKKAMGEANLVVTDEVKNMVKSIGQRYGKANVMKRAEELGIQFDKFTKKGDELPSNSNILWMRAHEAISKHISQGNDFKMGDEQDNGITATVGDYGDTKLTRTQSYAVDLAKRKSQNREPKAKRWAMKALTLDRGISDDEAEQLYNSFMEKARDARVMVHFDPNELLPSGVSLLEQLSSDGEFKNDYMLNRGYDKEHREANERDMFGDEYDEASEGERPNYAVVDLYNRGLSSHPYGGEVAFVLKNDAKKRITGSHIDSNNIGYGDETKSLRSMEDPHHLIIDRWTSRWKQPNKADKQRSRAFDAVLGGKRYEDDNRYFESHVHGGLKFDKDVDHILVPQSWKTDSDHKEKHTNLQNFAKLHGINLKYEGE